VSLPVLLRQQSPLFAGAQSGSHALHASRVTGGTAWVRESPGRAGSLNAMWLLRSSSGNFQSPEYRHLDEIEPERKQCRRDEYSQYYDYWEWFHRNSQDGESAGDQ